MSTPGVPHAIGASSPRCDAWEKASGETRYAADRYGEGLVWAGACRSTVPHAILGEVDGSEALQVNGVLAVLTHRDVKGTNRQGVVRKDQPVLVDDRIRRVGDAVALVLAESRAALEEALERVVVHYEPLPSVLDAEEAMRDEAPRVHEDHEQGNVLLHGRLELGAGSGAESSCDLVVESRFETQRQAHAFLETECGWARASADGSIHVVCSTQTPFRDRTEVAEALGLDPGRLRIEVPYVGGAFGGKDGVTVQSLLVLAALHARGRPVRMAWGRDESLLAGCTRHAARITCRLGLRKEGTFHFLDARVILDTGPYDHLGGVVLALALEHAGGPYRIPHGTIEGWSVYTNNPLAGAFRGFGVPQVTAALEQAVDMAAARLGRDPIDLRLQNACRQGDRHGAGVTLTCTVGLAECLERVAAHPLYRHARSWKAEAGPFKKRGVGVVALMHGQGYGPVVPDVASAQVELTLDGRFRVHCGVVDMGQGNASTALQIAGSILGQEGGAMELVLPDTARTLPCGSASASRCTYTFGNALVQAAEAMRARLLARVSQTLMVARAEVALVPGAVRHTRSGRTVPLAMIARLLGEAERVTVGNWQAPMAPEEVPVSEAMRIQGFPHAVFSFGAHLARVEVDELTGGVEVRDYLAVSECGRLVNPGVFHQQVQGAVAQGLGLALCEDYRVEEGSPTCRGFLSYVLPGACDLPEIASVAVELHEPSGPFGMKGAGELATSGPVPAVANALADACGVRLQASPFVPERVLEGLHGRGG